jgi:hypothetical protein
MSVCARARCVEQQQQHGWMDWKKGCISVINYAEMNLQFTPKRCAATSPEKCKACVKVRQGRHES